LESGSRHEGFIGRLAAEYGVAVASADYRTYPDAAYPDFFNDAARACEFVWNYGQSTGLFNRYFIGGAEAGAHIAMMLYFNPVYMREFVMSPDLFHGYIFDGGHPTSHPAVLKERCIDGRAVRIDKSAPIYYIDTPPSAESDRPPVLITSAEHEIEGIGARNDMLRCAMLDFGYSPEKVERTVMRGFAHGEYRKKPDGNGSYPINRVFGEFITKHANKIVNNNDKTGTEDDFVL